MYIKRLNMYKETIKYTYKHKFLYIKQIFVIININY